MNKVYAHLILFVILLGITGCTKETGQSSQAEDITQPADNQYGNIIIVFPDDWHVMPEMSHSLVTAFSPGTSQEDKFLDYVAIIQYDKADYDGASLTEIIGYSKTAFSSQLQNVSIISEEDFVLSGLKTKKITFIYNLPNSPIENVQLKNTTYYFEKGSAYYAISCSALSDEFSNYAPVFEKIINSVKFKD